MKLEKWASIAEIISGLAVVATLVFLVIGIRDNTATTRFSIYADIIDGINELDARVWSDPELNQLFSAYLFGETRDLGEAERRRLANMVVTQFRGLEKAYFAWDYGVIGAVEWVRIRDSICRNYERATSFGTSVLSLSVLTQEFRDFMAANCAQDDE